MPGERVSDTSSGSTRGSSDDDISLREHMQRQIDALRREVFRMDDDQGKYFERLIEERNGQYQQRFDAQKEAVDKANDATEKRFESVNEFRAQLSDQATRFMPRIEAEQRIAQNSEKIAAVEARHVADVQEIRTRLDLGQGRSTGVDKTVAWIFAAAGFVATIIAIGYAVTK